MRFLAFLFCSLFSVLGFAGTSRAAAGDVYGYSFTDIEGKPLPLSEFKGKVLLIVNTASRCGFTKQYAGLEKLYEIYKDRGLVVIGVPSNDFANQEPGSAAEIKKFCEVNFNITFPLTQKVEVIGDGAHPFFKEVRSRLGYLARPHWNFYKYLIGRDGRFAGWYSSFTGPDAKDLLQAIDTELTKEK